MKQVSLLLLFVFYFFYAGFNYSLIQKNASIPGIDAPNHALFCFQFYTQLKEVFENQHLPLSQKVKKVRELFSRGIIYWPKFVYLTSFPFLHLLGVSLSSIKLTNLFYLFLLILFTYLLTIELGGKKEQAFVAAVLVALYPLTFLKIQSYGLDFPLTTAVVVFFYFLLKTQWFKNSFYSSLAGMILGIGLLIKGQFLIFTLVIVSLYFLETMRRSFKEREGLIKFFKVLANLSFFLFLALQISGIWWQGKLEEVISALKEHTTYKYKYLESIPPVESNSIGFYLFYFNYLFLNGLGPLLAIFSGLLILNSIFRMPAKKKGFLLIWIGVPFLLFSFVFQVKQLRFLMPFTPALAIITALGLPRIKRFLKYFSEIFLLSLAGFQVLVFPFSNGKNLLLGKKFLSLAVKTGLASRSILPQLASTFIENLEKFDIKNRKVVIFRLTGIENGPLALQFWIESKAWERGLKLSTYDFYDQWLSVEELFNKKESFLILVIADKELEWERKNFWNKNQLLKKGDVLSVDFKILLQEEVGLKEIESVLFEMRRNSFFIADFSFLCYNCGIYMFKNVR